GDRFVSSRVVGAEPLDAIERSRSTRARSDVVTGCLDRSAGPVSDHQLGSNRAPSDRSMR
ncbi:MAG: hypothetical protein ABEH83_05565, partial [Halobacterium sp.]